MMAALLTVLGSFSVRPSCQKEILMSLFCDTRYELGPLQFFIVLCLQAEVMLAAFAICFISLCL